jgi:HK97 family phage portal protein
MGLLDRLAGAYQALVTRRDLPSTSRVVHFGRTTAGEMIDGDTALKQSAVWACLRFLSGTVAQLPWRVLSDANGTRTELRAHPLAKLLAVRPNPEMPAFAFRETMTWWAASRGNAVAEIERDARNVPIALWPLHPDRLQFMRDPDTGELVYRVWNSGAWQTDLAAADVFHVRGFGDGAVGVDVVSYAAESIGWARATEVFGAAYFGQGMAPSGVVTTKSKLSVPGLTALRGEIDKTFSGAKNAHRALILDADMEFHRLSVDPTAAQLVETRQHQVEEICRWFGVPPHKVAHLLRTTFSNIEHQSIEVVVDSITPWAIRFEQEADYKLVSARAGSVYTKLDLKGLLRGDYKSRQEGLQIMRRNGVINSNEWRALEDMNPIGDDGDKYIVEGNMTTLERIGVLPEPAAPAAEPAATDRMAEAVVAMLGREQPAPIVNVTTGNVEVLVDQPPQSVTLNVPEQAAPVVNVTTAPVTVNTPEQAAPVVNLTSGAVTVNVPEQPSPVVNVAPAEVTINQGDVTVEAQPITLEANMPEQPAPVVNVVTPRPRATRTVVEAHDKDGRIAATRTEEI